MVKPLINIFILSFKDTCKCALYVIKPFIKYHIYSIFYCKCCFNWEFFGIKGKIQQKKSTKASWKHGTPEVKMSLLYVAAALLIKSCVASRAFFGIISPDTIVTMLNMQHDHLNLYSIIEKFLLIQLYIKLSINVLFQSKSLFFQRCSADLSSRIIH